MLQVSGVGLPTILTIVFLVLKLTGAIAWPWLLVFLPLIIGTGLGLVVLVFLMIMVLLVAAFKDL